MYGGSFLPFLTVILVKTKYYTKQWQIHNIRALNNTEIVVKCQYNGENESLSLEMCLYAV